MLSQIDNFVVITRALVREVMPLIISAVAADSRPPLTKADGSFVTATDHAVEGILTTRLNRDFPSLPILGEEGVARVIESGERDALRYYRDFMQAAHQIVMDPIDGTRNFVEGRPSFCVAVALTEKRAEGIWPIAGVVAVPVQGLMYWSNSEGVFREEINSGAVSRIQPQHLPVERISINSKDRAWLARTGRALKSPWVSSGSSVNDFLCTALGELDGSVVGSQRLWDLMAPLAIAERLGCHLINLESGASISAISAQDLSPDLEQRGWGLNRPMMILPIGRRIDDFIG